MIEKAWLFHCGYSVALASITEAGAPNEPRKLPFHAMLALHATEGPILIDAPFGREGPVNAGVLGSLLMATGAVTFERSWAVVPRIEELGFRASDVDHVLLTHLHWDHTGGMKSMAHSTFHVSRAEWQYATSLSGLEATRRGYSQSDFRATVSHVEEFDLEPVGEEFATDIFDDGSVTAVGLPGHSVGHCGYRLRFTDGREIFYLGDAVFGIREITHGTEPGPFPRFAAFDVDEAQHTVERLREYHADHPEVRILSAHDFELGRRTLGGPLEL